MNGTLYDALHVIFKRRMLIGIAFLVIFVPVVLATMSRPTVYRAAARLTVTQARVYPLLSPKEEVRNVPVNDLQLITATVENLRSRSFLRDAGEMLAERGQRNNGGKPPSAQWWASRLAERLEVTPLSNAPFIDIAYRAGEGDLAASVVNTVAERYVYYQAAMMFDNPTLRTFYDEQRLAAERGLLEAEVELVRFQDSTNIFSLDEQKLQLSRAHTQALEALDLNASHIKHAEADAKALAARLKDLPPQLTLFTFGQDQQTTAVNTKIVELELELNNLRQLYTDEDRRVKNITHQLELARTMTAERSLEAQRTPTVERLETNLAYQNILENTLRQEAAAEAFRARREELQRSVELTASRLGALNRFGYEFERLRAIREAKRGNYELTLNRLEQARTSEAMDRAGLTNVHVLDPAVAPKKPVNSRNGLTLTLGLMATLAAGVGGAFGLESIYRTVHGRRDGELRLGIPVLGVIREAA